MIWFLRIAFSFVLVTMLCVTSWASAQVPLWRTPEVLRTPAGRQAVGLEENELFLALLYLGRPREEKRPPERAPLAELVSYLD